MNDLLNKLVQIPLKDIYYVCTKMSNEAIYFESNPDYSDNARALFDYMISIGLNKKYHIYWAVNQPITALEKIENVSIVLKSNKKDVVKAIYSSKYVFYTHALSGWVRKKKNQVFINLWHGCGYKASVFKNSNRKFNLNAIISASKMFFDYVLVPGNIFIQTKSEFFNCPKEKVIPLGYPRYDLMIKDKDNENKINSYWNNEGKKLIMWMPTYRDSNKFTDKNKYWLPILSNDHDVEVLNEYCEKHNVLLVIKKHKNQEINLPSNKTLSSIRFIDDSDLNKMSIQLYSLMPYTDALITDYSSIAIDYLLLNKPIGFTLDDYDEYLQKRGFVFDNALDYMPGAHIYSLDDLKLYITQISNNQDMWHDQRSNLMNEMQNPSENYSKRILEFLNISND